MKIRSISVKISAPPDGLEQLLAVLERERDALIERGESETPLGKTLWAAISAGREALAARAARKENRVDLARLNARAKSRPNRL
jgi:hypothetical protein